MSGPTSIHLLEYPDAQKSALWGMKDLFDFAHSQAMEHGRSLFCTDISQQPPQNADAVILPPALLLNPPTLPSRWANELRSLHQSGSVLASVCSGAFLLAETGLLDGRRVTTHWRHAAAFREAYPDAIIDTDRLIVDNGDLVTAGGVMAWTDLALHFIERFGGRKLMLDVARMFVVDPPEREQSYYVSFVPVRNHSDKDISAIQALLQENPGNGHTIASMAEAVSISERSLLRRFKKATGLTPTFYLQSLRVEFARSRLELTRDSFERISWDAGYSDTAAFRRVFQRVVGLTPSDYRRRFGLGE